MAYTNYGNDVAKQVYHGVKFYFKKPDDDQTQKELAADFEKWWLKRKYNGGGSPVRPNVRAFQTFSSDPLTQEEYNGLINHTLTIYSLIRFYYADKTGNWFGDECYGLQDPTHDMNVSHPCNYHNNHRYRTKWRPTQESSKGGQ
jgi:hypothetical protein